MEASGPLGRVSVSLSLSPLGWREGAWILREILIPQLSSLFEPLLQSPVESRHDLRRPQFYPLFSSFPWVLIDELFHDGHCRMKRVPFNLFPVLCRLSGSEPEPAMVGKILGGECFAEEAIV